MYDDPQRDQPITTDLFYDTDEAREAETFATDEGAAEQHRDANTAMQEALDAVAADHLGGERAAILAGLQSELEKRGHWPQPRPWVEAVADEMEAGRVYHVGVD